jgi:hypothetical protein
MNIEQIKGNRYTPQKAGKSSSSSKTNRAESHSEAANSNDTQKAANLSLSGTQFDSEISLAKRVLNNVQQESLDSLKNIKQKINEGAYNSEDVHRKMSALIENDLATLTHSLPHTSDAGEVSPTLSDEHRKRLLEDPDVLKKVSTNIAKDLEQL